MEGLADHGFRSVQIQNNKVWAMSDKSDTIIRAEIGGEINTIDD